MIHPQHRKDADVAVLVCKLLIFVAAVVALATLFRPVNP